MDERSEWQKRMGVGEPQHVFGRHAGTAKTTVVRREDDGKQAGVQTEHWSGRVDATVTPRPVVRGRRE